MEPRIPRRHGGRRAAVRLTDRRRRVPIASATRAELAALGIRDFAGLVPDDLLRWGALGTLKGFIALVVGSFLVGFGTAWAGGCTSGRRLGIWMGAAVPAALSAGSGYSRLPFSADEFLTSRPPARRPRAPFTYNPPILAGCAVAVGRAPLRFHWNENSLRMYLPHISAGRMQP